MDARFFYAKIGKLCSPNQENLANPDKAWIAVFYPVKKKKQSSEYLLSVCTFIVFLPILPFPVKNN